MESVRTVETISGARPDQRLDCLDFARSLAIWMVILVHVTENVYSFDLDSMAVLSPLSRVVAFTGFTLGRLGVPIFLFLTGFLVLDRPFETAQDFFRFWKTKVLPLVVAYEIWTVLNELFTTFVQEQPFNLVYCLQRMIFMRSSALSHMWYLPMIIGIYLMIPFVSFILHHLPTKVLWLPLAVCLVYYLLRRNFNTTAGIVGGVSFTSTLSVEFTGGAYGFYLLCGYLAKKVRPRLLALRQKRPVVVPYLIVLTLLLFVGTVAFQLWSYKMDQAYNVFYEFAPLLFCALGLFLLILLRTGTFPLHRCWNQIARTAFGIYLIHNLILITFVHYGLLTPLFTRFGFPHSAEIVVLFVLVFLISFGIVKLISLLPRVSKVLFLL